MNSTPNVLTIAGSDSSGGAGIQADIKTFTALKVYGASVVTNVTAQNSQGVRSTYALPVEVVSAQLKAVLSDIHFAAIKIGMLYSNKIINMVATSLKHYQHIPIIVDPILVSSSGTEMLETQARATLINEILPLATLITPNLPESDILLKYKSHEANLLTAKQKASKLNKLFDCDILVKGGHGCGTILTDYLVTGDQNFAFSHQKTDTPNTHGTGCTLSSSIASYLALGLNMENAVKFAIDFTDQCIAHSNLLTTGKGYGPINHLAYP